MLFCVHIFNATCGLKKYISACNLDFYIKHVPMGVGAFTRNLT